MTDADDNELEQAMQDLEENTGVATLVQAIANEPEISREAAYAQQLQATFNADPSAPPYPRGLVLDLALKTQPVAALLDDYGITVEEFKEIVQHPVFRHDMLEMRDKLREEGFSFKVKAQAQAEQYLKEAWRLVHSPLTPANVRASLIQWTAKVAGLDNPVGQTVQNTLPQMAEQLKNLPDGELECRVMSIVLRNSKQEIREAQQPQNQPQIYEVTSHG